jgi:ABC-type lipoprotein export system ATPase subunit
MHGEEDMEMMPKLNEATTIIMVTYSPAYAEYGNRVVHLFHGHNVTGHMKEMFHV